MTSNPQHLRQISISEIANLTPPTLQIQTDYDVEHWKTTRSYSDYQVFLRRLNESVVGCIIPWEPSSRSQPAERLLALLDDLDRWIEEIPPLQTPQRFGNLAFRTWGQRLEERADDTLETLLGPEFSAIIPYVKPYLLSAFGSFGRMDYGTGHETSFALFLLCLTLVRFLQPVAEEERDLVLNVFLRYLRLCWKLQDVYRLEPAGSHGVWGLDDYCFLPYIFGSGQLRALSYDNEDQTDIPVSAILRPPLPPTNLYFMAIMRIHDVKHGPFHEHSSQLHSIAAGVPNWGKVNSGLFKMFEAEVLGKRVVVQHIPLGGLLEWESGDTLPSATVSSSKPPRSTPVGANQLFPSTAAPWASANSATSATPEQPATGREAMPPPTTLPSHRYPGAAQAPRHNPNID
ncbi:serine/threonine-protein phosphatase 2A activator 1 [Pholiota molesta]|nr:serine/threonine-protein phosphatase 2A activator 1 [Pholiota molesta]